MGHPIDIEKAASIKGWMSHIELEWLAKTSRYQDVIIEFGCYLGRSTRAICDNTKALVFAVDPWNGTYYDKDSKPINILVPNAYEQFRVNLNEYIQSEQLQVLRCHSHEFPELGEGFAGFCFLDGDHRYEEVKRDISIAERLVAKGGIIAGHDYTHKDWPGVKQAVDEIYPEASKVDSIWFIKNPK